MISNTKKIIAHRGGVVDAHRSENSFAAIEEAILRGYTHVEIDARITGDGHAVCFHNDTLLEETGVNGRISGMSLDAVTQTTLTRSGENIPTFEAFCAHCAGRIGVMIDLKGCEEQCIPLYAQEIETALTKHNLLDETLILINKIPVNNQDKIAQHFFGKTKVSWRQSLLETQKTVHEDPSFANNHYIFNHGADFTNEIVSGFHSLGLEVIVSINTHHYNTQAAQQQGEHHVKQMLQFGVDGLQIDSCYDIAL
jgi:glycerophosphoryl diester phosphodiesterase